MDDDTNTNSINMENPSVIINEVLSNKKHLEMASKKQLNDKSTSKDLVMIDVPLIFTNVVICQSKDVATLMNTKV